MIRSAVTAGFLALVVSSCGAQSTSSSTPPPSTNAQAQSGLPVIPIELSKTVDSKKLKTGDEVLATTAELRGSDGNVVPRGSKVVGHVTQATARANGSPDSTLGIAFDSIVLKDGKALPLKTVLQAVAPPPSQFPPAAADSGSQPANRSLTAEGHTQPGEPGGVSTLPDRGEPPAQPGANMPGMQSELTTQTTGVVGIHGLQMGQDGLISSSGKNVKLESGSRLILRVQSQ